METQQLTVVPVELEKAVSETGLAIESAQTLRDAFAPFFVKFHQLAKAAANIPADSPKAAKVMRLELKNVRVEADKTRKNLKEESLRRGKAIDGINNLLVYQLTPIEDAMEKIEKAAEIAENNRIAKLKAEREAELSPYADPSLYANLGLMADDQWALLLANYKAVKAANDLAAKQAEEARIAKEKAEAAERQRLNEENARLQAQLDKARAAAEEKAAEERKERAAAEEEFRKKREAAEKAAAEERKKREAAERELAEKERAEKAKAAAERRKARLAAAAPIREQFRTMASAIRAVPSPSLMTEESELLATEIKQRVNSLAQWIETQAENLEA